jgi:receptor protein-tyrosine kinase
VLAGQIEFEEAVQSIMVPSDQAGRLTDRMLEVVVAGPLPPNPHDLIESERMRTVLRRAEERYDLVVMDTPPMSVVSDAIPLIREVSGVIVVTRLGKSTRESITHLRKQLEHLKAPILGVVVNGFKAEAGTYGYGYGYGYGTPAQAVPHLEGNGAAPAEQREGARR